MLVAVASYSIIIIIIIIIIKGEKNASVLSDVKLTSQERH